MHTKSRDLLSKYLVQHMPDLLMPGLQVSVRPCGRPTQGSLACNPLLSPFYNARHAAAVSLHSRPSYAMLPSSSRRCIRASLRHCVPSGGERILRIQLWSVQGADHRRTSLHCWGTGVFPNQRAQRQDDAAAAAEHLRGSAPGRGCWSNIHW